MIDAKVRKDDEYYTQLSDIQRELIHYRDCFNGKKIYLNCDNPLFSEFWTYFRYHFREYGIKSLTATYIVKGEDETAYKYVCDKSGIRKEELERNGDFRSPECIELLKESDIVVTNPPFSLFGEFIDTLIEYKKDFLVIGTMAQTARKSLFEEFKNNRAFTGYTNPTHFIRTDGELKLSSVVYWYTSLYTGKKVGLLPLTEKYDPEKYIHYKNFDAIHIKRLKHIPYDYPGQMCVPLTFIDQYNPNQFELIGLTTSNSMPFRVTVGEEFVKRYNPLHEKSKYYANSTGIWYEDKDGNPQVPYTRLIIKNKLLQN